MSFLIPHGRRMEDTFSRDYTLPLGNLLQPLSCHVLKGLIQQTSCLLPQLVVLKKKEKEKTERGNMEHAKACLKHNSKIAALIESSFCFLVEILQI